MTSTPRLRAFVRRETRLSSVPDVPDVRLHVADDVMAVMAHAGEELGLPDPPLPFWAFPWAGGLAVCRYLLERPDEVAGRSVIDLASGSGLCAIVALRCGAASAVAIDIDPLSEAAVELNARANAVRIPFRLTDVLDLPSPSCDVILAGDVAYEETMANRMIAWLRVAAGRRVRVLLGDPGRRYLPGGLERLATYRVATTRELETAETTRADVYTIRPPA